MCKTRKNKMNLYDHQKKILMDNKSMAGLFLGTGSGKTRIALLLAHGRTLVICPKTQREDQNWEREAFILKFAANIENTLTVMSKEDFRKHAGELGRYDTVIVDEAHTCLGVTPTTRQRNKIIIPKASQLFETLEAYVDRVNPDRLYLVTATIIRTPMTVWAAAKILGEDWDFYDYRNVYYTKLPMPGRDVWVPRSDDATKDRLAETVRNLGYVGRLEDFFDVPEQTFKTFHFELTDKQKKRIKEMALEYPDPIARITKVHQIENGVLSGDEFSSAETFDNSKLDAIMDFAIEFPRMVIFVRYLAQIREIERALTDAGYKALTMTGSTKDRGKVLKEANLSERCILVVQSQISSGWQLGKTKEHPEYFDYNVMIFASMDYQIINRIQAEGRILRSDNLKKNLYLTLVVKGGIDEAVDKCLSNKKDFHERIFLGI